MTADDRIDGLYEGSASDFVKRRDALAKELKAAGDAAAPEAAALRKPTAAAWALNQGVRSDPAAAKSLAKAGQALAKAQTSVLEGKQGARDRLRKAKDDEQAAIERIVSAAAEAAEERLSPASLDKIRETLAAAAGDPGVAAEVAAGRVVADHRAIGIGGDLTAALAASPRKPQDSASYKRSQRAIAKAEKARDQAAERLQRAREELGEAQQQVTRAKSAVGDAEAEVIAASDELRRLSSR